MVVGTYVYHFAPQFLQCIVFLTSELNSPNIAPPNIFFPVEIFSTLSDPQVGHFGIFCPPLRKAVLTSAP